MFDPNHKPVGFYLNQVPKYMHPLTNEPIILFQKYKVKSLKKVGDINVGTECEVLRTPAQCFHLMYEGGSWNPDAKEHIDFEFI